MTCPQVTDVEGLCKCPKYVVTQSTDKDRDLQFTGRGTMGRKTLENQTGVLV